MDLQNADFVDWDLAGIAQSCNFAIQEKLNVWRACESDIWFLTWCDENASSV